MNITTPAMFRIDHVMLPVANIERAIAFYTSLFAMKVVESGADAKRKKAHLGFGARGEQATLELIETFGVTQAAPSSCCGHFCLHMSGVTALCDRLESAGGSFDRPLERIHGEVRRAWVRDPDGHLIEMSEATL